MTSAPEELTPWQQVLKYYATSPNPNLISPIKFMDEGDVFFVANIGPSSEEKMEHILATPDLLELLVELWTETTPSEEILDKLRQTDTGRRIIKAALG